MVSPVDNRDLVISHLYTKLGLDRAGAGVIYATPLDKMATYIPDDILQKMQKEVSK